MTDKISRLVLAMALALGVLAMISNPSRAALSTADRTDAAAAAAPKPATLAATSDQVPARAAAAAPVAPAAAPVAVQPRKTIVRKAKPRRIAAGARASYPCH